MTHTIRPRQLSTTSVDTVPQFIMTPGTYWSCKIFPQLSLVLATRGLAVPQLVIHIYNKPGTMWTWHKPCFDAKQPPCRKCPWTRLDLHQLQGFCSAAAHYALTSVWKPELKENFSFRGSIQQESLCTYVCLREALNFEVSTVDNFSSWSISTFHWSREYI